MAEQKKGYNWTSLDQMFAVIANEVEFSITHGARYEGIVLTGNYPRSFLESCRREVHLELGKRKLDVPVYTFANENEAKHLQEYRLRSGQPGYQLVSLDWFIKNGFNPDYLPDIPCQTA